MNDYPDREFFLLIIAMYENKHFLVASKETCDEPYIKSSNIEDGASPFSYPVVNISSGAIS